MINQAMKFLTDELNDYLGVQATTLSQPPQIKLSNVADADGKVVIPSNTLGISLINVEEERVMKDQRTSGRALNGDVEYFNPELRLNLYVLISANFIGSSGGSNTVAPEYEEGLKQLSYVIGFFQGRNVFTTDNSPTLDASVKKLIVELYSFSFEQQYNFWSVVGAKYMPSVLYRVRMLTYQEKRVNGVQTPIGTIDLSLNQR